ncbi:MAG: hypothetical protein ACLT1T_06220 [Oscillospiraceae bacterium]
MQRISGGQARIALGALAVELDALEADVFLRQRGREQGNGSKRSSRCPALLGDREFFHGSLDVSDLSAPDHAARFL